MFRINEHCDHLCIAIRQIRFAIAAGETSTMPICDEHDGLAVIDLASIDASMTELVGGKAASLGDMLAAGLAVPPGFCVTTGVYRQVVHIDNVLDDLEQTPVDGSAQLAMLAERARTMIATTPVADDIRAAVVDAYCRLGGHRPAAVAVRSSATAEDLPHASFAGQQDTYLNVVGIDDVLDAVRRCWASLWTDRAVTYRAVNGIEHRAVSLAVVIQLMIDAKVAGVLFTANPITGRRTEMVIDAAQGLGEAVVSGTVTPDHYRVDTTSGTVQGSGCLSSTHLDKLRNMGRKLERHFGIPQDIEWVIDTREALWVTQSRPITTLFPVPKTDRPGHRMYLSFNVTQGVLQPFTPIGICGLQMFWAARNPRGLSAAHPITGPSEFVDAEGWAFLDITEQVRNKTGRKTWVALIDKSAPHATAAIKHVLKNPWFSELPGNPPPKISMWNRLLLVPNIVTVPMLRIVGAWLRPATARSRAFRVAERIERKCSTPTAKTAEERLSLIERLPQEVIHWVNSGPAPVAFAGLLAGRIAAKRLSRFGADGDVMAVFRGMPNNPTTQMDLALWKLAVSIGSDSAARDLLSHTRPAELAQRYLTGGLPAAAQNGVANFLATYGFRAVAEIDLGVPRWSEDPSHVFAMLTNYLRSTDPELAPNRRFAEAAAEAEDKINDLVRQIPHWRLLESWAIRVLLRRARALAGLRELPKICRVHGLTSMREQLLHIGNELAGKGLLEQQSDIMFLDLLEARAALQGEDLRPLVAERRASYERELRRGRVPTILLSDGTDPEADVPAAPRENGVLIGMPAGPGTVTGVARVISDPTDAHVEPGEILVAPSTDPGWTPLFLTAKGLVTETGGPVSHGPTVAREYGIPAVVGVNDATTEIRTGQRITVDGSAGTIQI